MDRAISNYPLVLRAAGLWHRPIAPGTKACRLPNWQIGDNQLSPKELEAMLKQSDGCGHGLLMGSPYPDGSTLGALDIDRDDYVPLIKTLLRDPPSGRFGSKGAAYFVRVFGATASRRFKIKDQAYADWGNVVECLFVTSLCVIPPTIHPKTASPYHWLGKPIEEVDYRDLPIIEVKS